MGRIGGGHNLFPLKKSSHYIFIFLWFLCTLYGNQIGVGHNLTKDHIEKPSFLY